jgi:hypothetical protein
VPAQVRRTYRGEEAWFALLETPSGPRGLREAFIAQGISPTLAGQLVWFLDEQLHLSRHFTDTSRANYRRVLEELDLEKVKRAIPGYVSSRLAA